MANTIVTVFRNMGDSEMMKRSGAKFRDIGIGTETSTYNILVGDYGKK